MLDKNLFLMPEKIQTRWFTYENKNGMKGSGGTARFGRKGAPAVGLLKGERLVLAEIKESGTIRRIWMTLFDHRSPEALRGLKLQIYWDGCKKPAVEGPVGDFFCHGPGHIVSFQNFFFSSPEGRSFNCCVPMPFKKSAKVVIVNESDKDNGIYYEVDATLGDKHPKNMLYFHSFWRRENYTKIREDMVILPNISGAGRFLGANLGVRLHPSMIDFWWGEGEVKIYLDGDKDFPTLCGTGTEDYIGTGYGQGLFNHLYQGCQYVSERKDVYGFYRLHIPDHVYFYKNIKVAIQVMGGPMYKEMLRSLERNPTLKFMKAGAGGEYYTKQELENEQDRAEVMERIDDYCATAYWYMDSPKNNLPPIDEFKERVKDIY